MLKTPKTPWPVRIIALILGCFMSLYIFEVHAFGAKFGRLMGNYLKPPPVEANGIPSLKGDPGVVPVSILHEPPPAKK
jgi:hypothetical protein